MQPIPYLQLIKRHKKKIIFYPLGRYSLLRPGIENGPHYYQWQRDFLYSEEDRRVMLIMNMENHLTDEELYAIMEEKWGC